MEGLPMVYYSTGTMESLLDKLTNLKNPSNPTEEFSVELKEDLLGFKKDLVELAVPKCKVCMKQVRELVFEIEDWIDKPETNMVNPSDTHKKIKYFRTKIKEACERFIWYYDLFKIKPTEPDFAGVAPSNININPQQLVEEKCCHGLLDDPRDELVKRLTDEKEEMLKVVSVVGREGLGKTTLAKEIYSELQLRGKFECQAFVSVGRRRPMREILEDIFRQVNPWTGDFPEMPEVITELRKYLDKKRYFILVDGIWSTWAWKVITCALPNNRGSRVMTTTCIIDVANSCSSYPNYDVVYQMEALRDKNSEILFHSRMTCQEERMADFEKVCGDMLLNMCDGMPLAIIVAAGLLLARRSAAPSELKMLQETIDSSLKQYSTSDGMTKILHMSYADLSLPLRSCFLYLGLFLENYTITKDRLICLWGAEGFIPKRDKECLWVTGERYFNELISRRLIQPVFTIDDDQAVGCTVHTVILDFIRSISREENFATRATELNSGPFPCDTIRRFSLDCCNEDEADTLSTSSVHLSSMRSLTVFGDVEGKLDPLSPDSPVEESLLYNAKGELLLFPVKKKEDERISDPQGLPSVSKHVEEMHATKAPGGRIMHQSSMRPLTIFGDDERKLDPTDSPADDERISDPHGLPSVSKHVEEMHAAKAPRVRVRRRSRIRSRRVIKDDEGKLDPQGLPSVSKHGEDMHATEARGVPVNILSAFKLLRVLDLQDTKNLENHHLEGIVGLVLLRYLGLAGTGIYKLPEKIGELEQLETLDLRSNTWLTTFPESRVKLKKVRHLLLPGYAKEIWEMPELEVASGIRVESSSSLCTVAQLLSKSEQLRMLGLVLKVEPIPTANDLKSVVEEVVKSKLQSLSIDFRSDRNRVIPIPIPELVVSWERVTAALAKQFEPQRFELKISGDGLRRVPPNMGSLASLTHLIIVVDDAKAEDFLVLGGLTNLVLLQLTAYECSEGERLIIKGGIFPCLKVFSYKIRNGWTGLKFEEGAMPQLRRLRCTFPGNEKYPYIGIKHLTCLTRVHAIIDCSGAAVSVVEATEAAIRGQASAIATKPTLELVRENEYMMV